MGGLTKEWTSGQQWLRLHGYVFLCMKERDEIVDSSGYLKARSLSERLLPRRRRRTSDFFDLFQQRERVDLVEAPGTGQAARAIDVRDHGPEGIGGKELPREAVAHRRCRRLWSRDD